MREGMNPQKLLQWLGAFTVVTIVTLAALEVVLRVADLRELREGVSERSLSYQYDAELGWVPIPGSSAANGFRSRRSSRSSPWPRRACTMRTS